jgi:hypothetical protein
VRQITGNSSNGLLLTVNRLSAWAIPKNGSVELEAFVRILSRMYLEVVVKGAMCWGRTRSAYISMTQG